SSPSYQTATGQHKPAPKPQPPAEPAGQAISPLRGILKAAKRNKPAKAEGEPKPKRKRTRSRRKKTTQNQEHTKSEQKAMTNDAPKNITAADEQVIRLR